MKKNLANDANGRSLLSEGVYDHLVARLANRQLKVGERIQPSQLADELSVSRTTVNRALERLIEEGCIKTKARGQLVVAARPKGKITSHTNGFHFSNQTDRTYETLLERILKGEFAPGEILKERPLAQSMGVNPSTVRRAAEWLSKDGLLERIPRRGWRVTVVDSHDIHDCYQVRLLLEPLAIEGAIMRLTDEELSILETEADRLIAAGEKVEAHEHRQADYQFHRALIEASGNRILFNILDPIISKVMLLAAVNFRFKRTSGTFEEHKAVLQLMRQRDEAGAVRKLKAHLQNAMKHNFTKLHIR